MQRFRCMDGILLEFVAQTTESFSMKFGKDEEDLFLFLFKLVMNISGP